MNSSPKNNLIAKVIINYEDYKKLSDYYNRVKMNKDTKTSGNRSEDTIGKVKPMQDDSKQLAANQINKEFNIESDTTHDNSNNTNEEEKTTTVKVIPMEDATVSSTSDSANTMVSNNNLLQHIDDNNYKTKARKLFESIKLDNYQGGIFTLDNEQYLPEQLKYIVIKLYGSKHKIRSLDHVPSNDVAKFNVFINSLNERKLKKYVKNKAVFRNITKHWWMLE